MVGEIVGAFEALKAASDMVKSLIGLLPGKAASDKLVQLQLQLADLSEKLAAAQVAGTARLERIRELEGQLEKLEDWDAEKQRYELVELYRGSLAYAVKEAVRGSEPPHYICPACYQKGEKSLLQGTSSTYGGNQLSCPVCGLEITRSYDV